jgi:hypothetical protein
MSRSGGFYVSVVRGSDDDQRLGDVVFITVRARSRSPYGSLVNINALSGHQHLCKVAEIAPVDDSSRTGDFHLFDLTQSTPDGTRSGPRPPALVIRPAAPTIFEGGYL